MYMYVLNPLRKRAVILTRKGFSAFRLSGFSRLPRIPNFWFFTTPNPEVSSLVPTQLKQSTAQTTERKLQLQSLSHRCDAMRWASRDILTALPSYDKSLLSSVTVQPNATKCMLWVTRAVSKVWIIWTISLSSSSATTVSIQQKFLLLSVLFDRSRLTLSEISWARIALLKGKKTVDGFFFVISD